MKIGIYTQPLRFNYGGLLQAWALQTVLRRMEHEVVTFDPNPYKFLPWWKKPLSYTKRLLKNVIGQPCTLYKERKYNTNYDIKMRNLQPFIDSNIRRKGFWKTKDLNPSDYDVLIAGSDQVWRPRYNITYRRTIENAFLDFAEKWDVLRIAYAASFGTDKWEYNRKQTKRCSLLAKKFSAISVREKSGIKLCKEHFGVDALHVLDPTMLLLRKDYEELIDNGQPTCSPKGDLLCYILDESEEVTSLINRVAQEKHLTPFRANSRVNETVATIEEKIQPPVEQWLRNFKEAKFVVTDSFHACVFSIIFGKPFIVIGNEKRGMSRYESLLSDFHLTDNLISSVSEYDAEHSYTIPPEAMTLLTNMRSISIDFLKSAIEKNL